MEYPSLPREAFTDPSIEYNRRTSMAKGIGDSLKAVTGAVLSTSQYLSDEKTKTSLINEMKMKWPEVARREEELSKMTPDKLAEKVYIMKTLDDRANKIKADMGSDVSLPSPVMMAMEMPGIAQLSIAEKTYDDIASGLKSKKEATVIDGRPVSEAYKGVAAMGFGTPEKTTQLALAAQQASELATQKAKNNYALARLKAKSAAIRDNLTAQKFINDAQKDLVAYAKDKANLEKMKEKAEDDAKNALDAGTIDTTKFQEEMKDIYNKYGTEINRIGEYSNAANELLQTVKVQYHVVPQKKKAGEESPPPVSVKTSDQHKGPSGYIYNLN